MYAHMATYVHKHTHIMQKYVHIYKKYIKNTVNGEEGVISVVYESLDKKPREHGGYQSCFPLLDLLLDDVPKERPST